MILSSGWDNTLKIYDVEKGYPIASIGGINVSRDSIDVLGDMCLTGSYRNENEISLISIKNEKVIFTFDYIRRNQDQTYPENGYILGARFSSCGNFLLAGGAGKNELRVWINNCDTSQSFKQVMHIGPMGFPVVALDTSKADNKVAVALSNG